MPGPYPLDLRKRISAWHESGDVMLSDQWFFFGWCETCAAKLAQRHRQPGTLERGTIGRPRGSGKLDQHRHLATLDRGCESIVDARRTPCHPSRVVRPLERCNLPGIPGSGRHAIQRQRLHRLSQRVERTRALLGQRVRSQDGHQRPFAQTDNSLE